jgi:hypothetical protein
MNPVRPEDYDSHYAYVDACLQAWNTTQPSLPLYPVGARVVYLPLWAKHAPRCATVTRVYAHHVEIEFDEGERRRVHRASLLREEQL